MMQQTSRGRLRVSPHRAIPTTASYFDIAGVPHENWRVWHDPIGVTMPFQSMSLQHWFQTEGETIDFPHEQRWIDAVDRRQGVQIFTPPWALQLIAIQERLVSRVERLIEEQTSRRSSVGTLHTLGDGAIPLAIPIMFSKEEDQEGVSLSVDELGVYVWGETDHEALSELTRQITRLWTDLEQAPEAELGPALIRTKNVLRSMVTADAKNIQRQRS